MDICLNTAVSAGLGTAVALGFLILCVWGFGIIGDIRRKSTEEEDW